MAEYGELRRLAGEASPAPWRVEPYVIGTTVFGGTVEDVSGGIVTWGGAEGTDPPCTTEDAAYIAAASPDVILALLDERDRLLTALHDARPAVKHLIGENKTQGRLDGIELWSELRDRIDELEEDAETRRPEPWEQEAHIEYASAWEERTR